MSTIYNGRPSITPTVSTGRPTVTTISNGRPPITTGNSFLLTNGGSYLLTNGTDRLIIAIGATGTVYTGRPLI